MIRVITCEVLLENRTFKSCLKTSCLSPSSEVTSITPPVSSCPAMRSFTLRTSSSDKKNPTFN